MHQILHMKGGIGEESYANNSKSQSAKLSRVMPLMVQAVLELCGKDLPELVTIADLGCSSGPTSLSAVTQVTSLIYKRCIQLGRSPPEFSVFLNDLPGNDFNTVFKSLPVFHDKMRTENGQDFPPCYISGVPGSFYGRLFPSNSLHFVHSASSLHWLSQVPPELNHDKSNPLVNKGKIYISKTSPPAVAKAYQSQFQRDFSSFLHARSKEVVPGGRMVLTFSGRNLADPSPDSSCLLWDYLGQAFQDLVTQGLIEEGKLDTYNTPYYEPYTEDVKAEIEKEGSFVLDDLVTVIITWADINGGVNCDRATTAKNVGKAIRAVNESMIQNHFGAEIMDCLFQRFCEIMAADTKEVDHVNIVVSLIRKDKQHV
ncbi:Jasmonate O-methyltransferase, putative [Ricinus communis]|uniref:Jasmonate O-methyltransferase, putative n=2 Tax=Ricinus communis TaxID=3988 RepID=B9SUG7_RICCO|nr:Jasmonate O-methyltransferase, putative [Ricinus communis]